MDPSWEIDTSWAHWALWIPTVSFNHGDGELAGWFSMCHMQSACAVPLYHQLSTTSPEWFK